MIQKYTKYSSYVSVENQEFNFLACVLKAIKYQQ